MFSKSVLRYVLSFGLLAFFSLQMDWGTLLEGGRELNPLLFLGSVVCVLGQILFLNFRWHALLNAGRVKVPFSASVLINIAGYFANVMFIASVGGIIAKSGLAIRQGVPVFHSVFATFLDRFMTLFALVFLSLCGLPFLTGTIDSKILIMFLCTTLFLLFVVGLFLVLLRSGLLRHYILSGRRKKRLLVVMRNFFENKVLMGRTLFHSVVAQLFFISSVYVLSLGFEEHNASTLEFLALLPILSLIASLPISFGGWGVREGAFIYGLGLIGFSMESSFLLSVQVGFVGLVAPFLVGVPYLFQKEMHLLLREKKKKEAS